MGGGKAAVDHWVAVVKPGRVLFEVAGVPAQEAMEALRLASHKLPIPTRTVQRDRLCYATKHPHPNLPPQGGRDLSGKYYRY